MISDGKVSVVGVIVVAVTFVAKLSSIPFPLSPFSSSSLSSSLFPWTLLLYLHLPPTSSPSHSPPLPTPQAGRRDGYQRTVGRKWPFHTYLWVTSAPGPPSRLVWGAIRVCQLTPKGTRGKGNVLRGWRPRERYTGGDVEDQTRE